MDRGQGPSADRIAAGLTRRQLIEIDACSRCGECQRWCPVYPHERREEITARGKVAALRRIVSGAGGPQSAFLDGLYACSACGQCHVVCPIRINTPDLWEQARQALAAEGLPQPSPQLDQLAQIKTCNNSYARPQEERGAWAGLAWKEGLLLEPVRLWQDRPEPLLYFAGCTASFDPAMQTVAVQTARLLQEAGVRFSILGPHEPCCASKLRRMGDGCFAAEARQRAALLVDRGVRRVVVSCAGCFKGLHGDYRGILPASVEVLHLTQLLDRLIVDGRLKPKYSVEQKITYHDPCHLGRHSGVYEEPRRIIGAIRGLELFEMRRNGPFSACCGMGGGLKLARPDLQKKMSAARVHEAEKTGAVSVVTPCQTCVMGLTSGAAAAGSGLAVRHLNDLLIRAVAPDLTAENIVAALERAR